MCAFGWTLVRSGDVSVVSNWKWPLKRPVITHIKARSKHSFETETLILDTPTFLCEHLW